jgi:SAM-dependent methyltransferase
MSSVKQRYKRTRDRLFPFLKERKQKRKAVERQRRFDSPRWQRADRFAARHYDSYEEYLTHQAEKLDKIYERRSRKDEEEIDEFRRRFTACKALQESHNVLCLGARLGAEVRALRDLGYFAVGLDLNPGRDNPYVFYGDFHNLEFIDDSVDAVYTNALDHVFDLSKVIGEVRRILRPGGLFVLDYLPGFEEGFIPGEYESTHWRTGEELLAEIERQSGFLREEAHDHGRRRRDQWLQMVFRKPAAPAQASAESA